MRKRCKTVIYSANRVHPALPVEKRLKTVKSGSISDLFGAFAITPTLFLLWGLK